MADPKDYVTITTASGKKKTVYSPRPKPKGIVEGAIEGVKTLYSDIKSGAVKPFGGSRKMEDEKPWEKVGSPSEETLKEREKTKKLKALKGYLMNHPEIKEIPRPGKPTPKPTPTPPLSTMDEAYKRAKELEKRQRKVRVLTKPITDSIPNQQE